MSGAVRNALRPELSRPSVPSSLPVDSFSNYRCAPCQSLPGPAFFSVRWAKGKSADFVLLQSTRVAAFLCAEIRDFLKGSGVGESKE